MRHLWESFGNEQVAKFVCFALHLSPLGLGSPWPPFPFKLRGGYIHTHMGLQGPLGLLTPPTGCKGGGHAWGTPSQAHIVGHNTLATWSIARERQP